MNLSRLVFPLLFFVFFDTVAQSNKGVIVYNIGNTQQISAIAIDNQNTKWVGTSDQGLFSMPEPYNPITQNIEQFTIYNSSLPSNRINGLSLEGKRLAIATDAGLALIENHQWTIYNISNSGLVSNNVLSVLLKKGVLYAGTHAGLSVLSGGQWTSYTRQGNGIPSDTVHDIVLTASDELWLATEAGLARIKPGLKVYTPDNSQLQAAKVVGINADKWGKLWVKTKHAYGFSIQILTNNTFYTPHQLYPDLDSRIQVGPRLVNDARGNIWCVGETYESTTITRFNQYSSRSFYAFVGTNTGKTLAPDKDNRLWFAKHFGQLAAFWELDRFAEPLPTSQALTTKNIQARISSCEDLFATHSLVLNDSAPVFLMDFTRPWFTAKHYNLILSAANQMIKQEDAFFPGPVLRDTQIVLNLSEGRFASYFSITGDTYQRTWALKRTDIETHKRDFNKPFYTLHPSIATWPANADMHNGLSKGLAPFADANGDGVYSPESGDFPLIRGDEAVFFVFSTVDPHSPETNNQRLQLEIRGMAYVFNATDNSALNHSVFVNYQLTNVSDRTYEDFSFGIFNGYRLNRNKNSTGDNFVGCDTVLKSAYAYRARPKVQDISVYFPAVGITFLNDTINSYMRVFKQPFSSYFPQSPTEFYRLMRSTFSTGLPLVYGDLGIPQGAGPHNIVKYHFPGDPHNLTQWSEIALPYISWDRHDILALKPRVLHAGETICVDFVFTAAMNPDGDSLGGVSLFKQYAAQNLNFYSAQIKNDCSDINYRIPQKVKASLTTEILLYPNPCIDYFGLELPHTGEEFYLEILNINGQLLLSLTSSNPIINISGLSQGIYIVRVKQKEHFTTARLVKLNH